jgi:hypothetical protein
MAFAVRFLYKANFSGLNATSRQRRGVGLRSSKALLMISRSGLDSCNGALTIGMHQLVYDNIRCNLRSIDLLSRPWIHDDDRFVKGLVQTLPLFTGGGGGIYGENTRAVGNEPL